MRITLREYIKRQIDEAFEETEINEVFSEDEIIAYINNNYLPEEVFSIDILNKWAGKNYKG